MTGNMIRPISKRAWELTDLKDAIASIWRSNEGFCENFFRILSYLVPFVPGLGWGVFVLEKIASLFGYGMSDLGGAIDRAMGWAPSTNLSITENDLSDGVGGFLKDLMKPNAASSEEEIVKIAFLGGLFKLIGAIPKLIPILWKAVKFLLLAFGLTKVGDVYSTLSGTTVAPGQVLLEQTTDKKEDKEKDVGLTQENLEGLMGLVTNPSALMQPFTKLV